VPTKLLARPRATRESASCFCAPRFATRTARLIGHGRLGAASQGFQYLGVTQPPQLVKSGYKTPILQAATRLSVRAKWPSGRDRVVIHTVSARDGKHVCLLLVGLTRASGGSLSLRSPGARTYGQPILVNPQPGLAFAVSMLANAIEGHLNSPKAVPTLATLLG
jgi:hypothetical protein